MKKNVLKLRLAKETLVDLDGDTWQRVAAGGASLNDSGCSECTSAPTSYCTSHCQ